jgi:hypothetical protein
MWKALNDSQYPLRVEQKSETEDGIGTRSIEFISSSNPHFGIQKFNYSKGRLM